MKKPILVVLVMTFLACPLMAQDMREVSIDWEDGLKPPYLMLDDKNQPIGIAVDMLTEILLRNHINPNHKLVPWKRCLVEIKEKKVDVVPNSSYKKDRAEYAYYTQPLYETHIFLFYKKRKFVTPPEILSVNAMKPYRVGGVLGFNYDQYEGKVEIDTGARSREALVSKLHHDRVDFAVLQKEVVLWLEKEGKVSLKGLEMLPDPMRPLKKFYVLTVKNVRGKQIKEIIDEGIIQLKKDGTMDNIIKRYLEGASTKIKQDGVLQ